MWQVLVPVKGGDRAKSRLRLDPRRRRLLADAMTLDTVEAVASCRAVVRVTVLCGRAVDLALPMGAVRLTEPDTLGTTGERGLNVSLSWALGQVQAGLETPGPVAVVVGDLPALTASMLDQVLAAAADLESGVVPDRQGAGTTVLTASHGAFSGPCFGPQSAAAHVARGAELLTAAPGVRCDVDTLEDLHEATALGVGPRTTAALAAGVH